MRPRLTVFDMDGVLTRSISSWQYVHEHFGVDNSENLRRYLAGEIDYMEFLRSDVRLWLSARGPVRAQDIISVLQGIPLRRDIGEAFSRLHSLGSAIAIISGGIFWLARMIGERYGADYVFANEIYCRDGFLVPDGRMVVDPKNKSAVLAGLQRRLGIGRGETVSVGDTEQDVGMFELSALSIAVDPKDEAVRKRCMLIINSDSLLPVVQAIEDFGR
ncbi:phosphoserine phosphatase [Thermogymnomonas acidicola]|uniref:phosphoserine phosphatase n=1 Tax=Thermogymnomonas acidicola TaxID=399579 RepID=A0AA37BRV2_9ARCH|nr:HAD-IB family phosphatase [Thermogymnomonas acidicola]GGM76250.1 phosphoserine phosphatase [Thermogymnomonas acidicola]